MVELYGEGLARILDAIDGAGEAAACRDPRPGAGRRRRRREPAADPRSLPGAARDARAGGARRESGPTWRRTAAMSSCRARGRRRAAAPGRGAATAARHRPRRSSSRSSRRSRRRRPTCSGSRSRGSSKPQRPPPRAGLLPVVARHRQPAAWTRPRARRAADGDAARRGRSRRGSLVANVGGTLLAYRDACAGLRGGARQRRLDGGVLACTGVRARVDLPRAGRARRRGAASSSRCRCCGAAPSVDGGGRDMTARPPTGAADAVVARLRRLAQRAGRSRRGRGRALRPLRREMPDRPPPPAAPRGAADPLRPASPAAPCGRATPGCGRPARARSARGVRAEPTSCGPSSRSRSASRSSSSASAPAASWRSTRARRGRPSASSTSRRGTSWWRRTPCSRLEPEVEALIVNRIGEPPQYAIVPIDRCYELVGTDQGELAGHLGRHRGRGRRRGFFAACATAEGVA